MKIELSKVEALVLYDWIYQNKKYFDDDAVKCVFWSVESLLERELVDLFYKDYTVIIENAKEAVKENYGIYKTSL